MKQRENIFTDEELIEEYNKNKHLGKLAHHFKVPVIQIWRKCQKLGLAFKTGGKTEKLPLNEILEGFHGYYPTNKLRKRIIKENILPYKCNNCGIDKWNGSDIVLQLDHINGESTDHRLENLQLLCPNCHSQTDTWCGKNKG